MGKRLFVILSIGLANAFVFTVLATGFTQQAFAQSPPAVDKYAAAGSTTIVFGPTITGTTTATLLSEQINSSNTADLVLQVSLECTIFTAQTTSFADSDARVTVWIEIDGVVVPVTSDAAGNPTDPPPVGEVTFCDHTHVNFSGTAFDLEQLVHATAFNWIKLNVGAGLHTVVVRARLSSFTILAGAQAAIGRRTLIIEPTHMAVNQDVQPFTP